MSRIDRRVVVTGAGAISPLGHDWASVHLRLRECRNAVRHMQAWDRYEGLNTRLAAPAEPFELPAHYNRKTTRSMGRVAIMAVRATELALEQALKNAGLADEPIQEQNQRQIQVKTEASASPAPTFELNVVGDEPASTGMESTNLFSAFLAWLNNLVK